MSTSTVHDLVNVRTPHAQKPAAFDAKLTATGIGLLLFVGFLFWAFATR